MTNNAATINTDSLDGLDFDKLLETALKQKAEGVSENSSVTTDVPANVSLPIDNSEMEGLKSSTIPKLRGTDYPEQYVSLVNRVAAQYSFLPVLDYDDLYNEIRELTVQCNPTPTLQVLNDELQKVQGAKDRVSEIFMDVIKCFNFKVRSVDILTEAWGKFTSEKNADSRKGDCAYRLSNFAIDLANTESLYKACMHVLKNLDSLHDNLSRRLTVFQLLLKMNDPGRSHLPDYDFEKRLAKENEVSAPLLNNGELPEEHF